MRPGGVEPCVLNLQLPHESFSGREPSRNAARLQSYLENGPFVVLGNSSERISGLIEQLRENGISISEFHVSGEPTVETILSGLEQAQAKSCKLVIGIGGGSVIDTGKAIAALMKNPGQIYDYLEVVG